MNPFNLALIIIAIVVVFGGVFYWRYQAAKKRREALSALAVEMRWTFSPGRDESVASSLGAFHLFSLGHSKEASNVLRGQTERGSALVFDYRYSTGSGKNRHTSYHTVLCLAIGGRTLPRFTLARENILHKIGAAFGYKDINFENFPEFSKRYLLRGEDEMAIRDLFNASVINFFEGEQGLCMEGAGEYVLLYPSRGQLKVEDIRPFLQKGERLLGLLGR